MFRKCVVVQLAERLLLTPEVSRIFAVFVFTVNCRKDENECKQAIYGFKLLTCGQILNLKSFSSNIFCLWWQAFRD